jgi:Domain of unknown function (DUF4394)
MLALRKWILALGLAVLANGSAKADFVVGLVGGSQLVTFDTATPGTLTAPVAISGLRPDETIVGIDFRPATPNTLVGVGNLGGSGYVYTIDVATGVATAINTSGFTLTGNSFGVDFNPVPNALRIVSDAGQNLRITAGGTGTVNSDTTLSEAGIVAAAYSNNFAGATVTTLYELNAATDSLVRQGGLDGPPSPNGGVITTIGSLGVDISNGGFDISGNDGTAYAVLTTGNGSGSGLYTIDLTTGQATLVGEFGEDLVQDLAVQQVPAPAGALLLALGLAGLAAARRRIAA